VLDIDGDGDGGKHIFYNRKAVWHGAGSVRFRLRLPSRAVPASICSRRCSRPRKLRDCT